MRREGRATNLSVGRADSDSELPTHSIVPESGSRRFALGVRRKKHSVDVSWKIPARTSARQAEHYLCIGQGVSLRIDHLYGDLPRKAALIDIDECSVTFQNLHRQIPRNLTVHDGWVY